MLLSGLSVVILGFSGVNCEAAMTTASTGTTAEPCVPTDSCEGGHYTCDDTTGKKICNAGYKGPECKDRDLNEKDDPVCPSAGPCKNGGTCWNKTCCCVQGYSGPICGTEINECKSSPCVNGGTCKDEIGFYNCLCLEGKLGCTAVINLQTVRNI